MELWIKTRCEHSQTAPHDNGCGHNCGWTYGRGYQHGAHWWCPGGSEERLDPEQVLHGHLHDEDGLPTSPYFLTVQDVLDALGDQ